MADWPSTLPQAFLQDSFSDTENSVVVRTSMATGPAKVRRRFTSAPTYWEGEMILDSDQKDTFKAFYRNTIGYGSIRFNFPNQYDLNGTLVEVRMRIDTDGRAYRLVPDGDTQDYVLSLSLEVFV